MTAPVVLVMAKVPRPGQVKTRLATTVGDVAAARLALAALLDTLEACEEVFPPGRRYLALTGTRAGALSGDLDEIDPSAGRNLRERLDGWVVLEQRGAGLGARIENAHRDVHAAASAPVVQIGMDTPHLTPDLLRAIAALVAEGRPVLGRAEDGGWWVLASVTASDTDGLTEVPMSTARTGARTWDFLCRNGRDVAAAPAMRDVDDAADARLVASAAPGTLFAATWRRVDGDEPVSVPDHDRDR